MKTLVFQCAEYEEYGFNGWKPSWFPNGDPATGMGVAHDVLEHSLSTDGTLNEEMRAMGAGLFIRGGGGYFSGRHHSVSRWHQNVSADFPDHIRRFQDETHTWVTAPPKGKGTREIDDWAEEELALFPRNLRELIEAEDYLDFPEWMLDSLHMDWIIRWARVGYRWAQRRYGCPAEACYMFQRIEKRADELLKHAEQGLTELCVKVELKTMTAEVWERYPEFDEYE